MSDFRSLFAYEFKLQFPHRGKQEKPDIVGTILSLFLTLVIVGVFGFLVYAVAKNYVVIKINKIEDPIARAHELLNLAYLVILVAMSLVGLEKMRKTLTQTKAKEMFLRLPVKQSTMFLSKLSVLAISNYLVTLLLILPVNGILYVILKPAPIFFGMTALASIFLPLAAFLVSTVLLIPYIKLIDFLGNRYVLIFIAFSAILIGAFFAYSELLAIVQSLLETGDIKFLFNEEFINFLQKLLVYAYPANLIASLVLSINVGRALPILAGGSVVAFVVIYLVTRGLYYVTLYKNDNRQKSGKVKNDYATHGTMNTLVKKEFISIFRDSGHIFSYFAIAAAMPMMVYCCYTLFESLLQNSLGITASFSLSLLVTLIFSILTNTFCATNITRDGVALLKTKVLPVRASTILLSKVLLCSVVSSVSVILSQVVLMLIGGLETKDGLFCMLVGVIFSTAQIFFATRVDLNNTRLSLSTFETERISSKTVAKVTGVGFVLALAMGICSLLLTVFSGNLGDKLTFHIPPYFVYLLPIAVSVLYCTGAVIYYCVRIEQRYEKIVL